MMQLTSPPRFTSFYESFSDLMFATMAIFFLLMMIFLGYLNREKMEALQEKSDELDKIQEMKSSSDRQLESLLKNVVQREPGVASKEIELVVAVDMSSSMKTSFDDLAETLKVMSKVMPEAIEEFKLGIVAYRQGEQDVEPYVVFPLRKVSAAYLDAGESIDQVEVFLSGIDVSNGRATILPAVKKSLMMFSDDKRENLRQILMILGDVGPYENNLDDFVYSEDEKKYESEIIGDLVTWKSGENHRIVVSYFSGGGPKVSSLEDVHVKYKQSYRFFKDIAEKTGSEENFTDNPGKMLSYIVSVAFSRE